MGREDALTCSSVTTTGEESLAEGDELRASCPDGVTSLPVRRQSHSQHSQYLAIDKDRRQKTLRRTKGLVLQWLALACFAGLRLLLFLAAADSLPRAPTLPIAVGEWGFGVSIDELRNRRRAKIAALPLSRVSSRWAGSTRRRPLQLPALLLCLNGRRNTLLDLCGFAVPWGLSRLIRRWPVSSVSAADLWKRPRCWQLHCRLHSNGNMNQGVPLMSHSENATLINVRQWRPV